MGWAGGGVEGRGAAVGGLGVLNVGAVDGEIDYGGSGGRGRCRRSELGVLLARGMSLRPMNA